MQSNFDVWDFLDKLDVHAVTLAYLPILAVAGCLLLFGWPQGRRPPLLTDWGIACLCAAIATVLFALRGIISPKVVILGANVGWVTAWALLWAGVQKMRRKTAPIWLVMAPAILWLIASATVPNFYDSLKFRQYLSTILTFPFCFIIIKQTLFPAEKIEISRGGMICGILNSIYIVSIILLTLTNHSPSFNAFGTMLIGTLFVSIAFTGVVIAHEQLTADDAALLASAQLREAGLRADLAEREAIDLRHVQTELSRLLGGLPLGVFLREVQPSGHYKTLFAGGEIEMVSGWQVGALRDLNVLNTLRAPDAPAREIVMARALREGSVIEEWQLRQPDGSWRWIRTQLRCISRNPDGSGDVVGFIQNIDRERMAETQAQRAGRLASLGEMATGLAHELRQPLTSISILSENARHNIGRGDPGPAEERLDKIIQQTQRASQIIEHLRAFAGSNEDDRKPVVVSLEAAVNGALLLTRFSLHGAAAEVEVDLGTPPLSVMAAPIALERVLVVLLINARDALESVPSGHPRRVRITATAEAAPGEHVVITVADTGGGIAAAVMPRIFEPFVTTKGPHRGIGLGLSTAFGLIKAMDGTMQAENRDGGAVFTIRLKSAARSA